MTKPFFFAFTFLCCLLGPQRGQTQTQIDPPPGETGRPFIQDFSPKEYNAYSQNWAIAQGHDGLMYFGNGSGVLVYDGVSWRLIPVSNNTVVRSLAVDEDGRVYVGARGEFGYLAPDGAGQLRYVSLLDRVQPEMRDFADVWEILANSQGVYFRTVNYLFRLNRDKPAALAATAASPPDTLQYWIAKNPGFFFAHKAGDSIFLTMAGTNAVVKVKGDDLQEIRVNDDLQKEEIYALLPLSPSDKSSTRSLAISRRGAGYVFQNDRFEPLALEPSLTEYLRAKSVFRGAVLNDGTLALGTFSGGVVIMNQQGRLLHILNKASGLRDDGVFAVYAGREGALWLALNNGLARVELPSPLAIFNEAAGVTSNIEAITRHRGLLYVATGRGLHYLSSPAARGNPAVFMPVAEVDQQAWALLSTEDGLMVATTFAIHLVNTGKKPEVLANLYTFQLCRSRFNRNFIFLGHENGLRLLQKAGGRWQFAGRVPGINQQIRTIVEEAPGRLWLGTRSNGYFRVALPEDFVQYDSASLIQADSLNSRIEQFGKAHSVPDGFALVYRVAGHTVFATQKGLRRFDESSRHFVPDSSFGARFADTTRWINPVYEDQKGNVWISSGKGAKGEVIKLIPLPDGGYEAQATPFQRLTEPGGSLNTIYADSDHPGLMWFGTSEIVLRFDANVKKNYAVDFQCLIRRVTANQDSVIYDGAAQAAMQKPPVIAYAANALRFEFAAASFETPSQTEYQTYLEGFDEGWSNWAAETQKDYTNLPEGDYRFRVRARNVYQHLSGEGEYAFTILPPWYRTWWAYAIYAAIVWALFYSVRRYEMSRQRFKHSAELRQMEAEKLQEVDALKSRFFANISHEFRTPLTLIMGQLESELNAPAENKDRNKLQMALRNARQLLRLINQLLDLSKIEAGRMTLAARPGNLVPLLRSLTASFESFAQQKNLNLRFEAAHDAVIVNFDQEKIEKVVYNLLSNAMKFTPEGGKVAVAVTLGNEQKTGYSEQSAKKALDSPRHAIITVRDSGIGIPAERLPHIFDRFYQVDASQTREHEGTGIGLALTKELVELHGGTISVESSEGFGTTFVVRLPVVSEQSSVASDHSPVSSDQLAGISEQLAETITPTIQHSIDPIIQQSDTPAIQQSTAPSEFVLIVEDNADVREYVRQHLDGRYRVIEAKDGEEGLTKAQEYIPDLIISDVMMPRIDGYELARRIRNHELTSHIPIIMLTAKAAEEEKLEGLETGVDAYLIKPFGTKELQVRVRKLIEMRRKLRQQTGAKAVLSPAAVQASSLDQEFLQKVREIIEANMDDENFSVDALAAKAGMGMRQLQRKLKALTDASPQQCIRSMRLQRAKQLLEQKAGTVSEIAFQVGYGDVTAFSKAFRAEYGQSPSEMIPGKEKQW
ncbi:response regulator [candidate division KSB1 bacterium]|nr:response regulator [candidate division KSB1 bacterium]